MEKIKVLIASVTFTLYFVTFARLHIKFKLNFKPLNCEVCLPFYVALVLLFCPEIVSEIIIVLFSGGILTALIARLISKL
jgi:NAD/NADP transhydrogenase beta subunit